MESKHYIDMAYEMVKDKYGNKPFTYQDLWSLLIKKGKLTQIEQEDNIGSLYTEILQDPRFIFTGNKIWRLKEYITRSEINALENSLYDFVQESDSHGDETEEESLEIENMEDDYLDYKNKFKNKSDLEFDEEDDNDDSMGE